jgi:hypothetical protein
MMNLLEVRDRDLLYHGHVSLVSLEEHRLATVAGVDHSLIEGFIRSSSVVACILQDRSGRLGETL